MEMIRTNVPHYEFLKFHRLYIRSLNSAWQTGRPGLLYPYIDTEYKGVMYSQNQGCLEMNVTTLFEGLNQAIKGTWNKDINWKPKIQMVLSNSSGNIKVISYRLDLYYPGFLKPIGIALMCEVWECKMGRWTLIREVQGDKDSNVESITNTSSFLKDHSIFFRNLIQIKQDFLEAEAIDPFISERYIGRLFLNNQRMNDLAKEDLLAPEEILSIRNHKKTYLARNNNEIFAHHSYLKFYKEITIEVFSSELWEFYNGRWMLSRSFQENFKIDINSKRVDDKLYY